MVIKRITLCLALLSAICLSACATAPIPSNTDLADDFSRAEILRYSMRAQKSIRAIPLDFQFPDDRLAGRKHGVDVSRHQGEIDWATLSKQSVDFAYVKASEGVGYADPTFARNWSGAAGNKIRRGAYHFLSARETSDPAQQAQTFLSTIGTLGASDLPPVLDLEWNYKRGPDGRPERDSRGREIDRWASVEPEEIVRRAQIWLSAVEAATGRKPIIYTNGVWWQERIGGAGKSLNGYTLWIADYRRTSLKLEAPQGIPEGFDWALWQFTEKGQAKGVKTKVDANIDNPAVALTSP